jgi:hypothetical protein
MTMAHTGVTAVPRVRGLRPVAGCVLGGLPPCPPGGGRRRVEGGGKPAQPRKPATGARRPPTPLTPTLLPRVVPR